MNFARFVTDRTMISAGFRVHAAPEAIDTILADWVAARNRLDRQITAMEELLAEREKQIKNGEWPAPQPTDTP